MESAKSLRRLVGLAPVFDDVIRAGPFDEQIAPPVFAFRITVVRESILTQKDRQSATRGIRHSGYLKLSVGLLGDALDVFHQRHGVGENALVDSLKNITHTRARLAESGGEGVIDMTASIRGALEEGSLDSKSFDDVCYWV